MVDSIRQSKIYQIPGGDEISDPSIDIDLIGKTHEGGLDVLLVLGLAVGYKIARGIKAATASAAINTGLASIVAFAVCGYADTATKATNGAVITAKKSGATLTVYRWKLRAATADVVAASVAGTVDWIAVGK